MTNLNSKIEKKCDEVLDDLYTEYTTLLSKEDSGLCFKSYFLVCLHSFTFVNYLFKTITHFNIFLLQIFCRCAFQYLNDMIFFVFYSKKSCLS